MTATSGASLPSPAQRGFTPRPGRFVGLASGGVIAAIFLARGGLWNHVGGRDTHAMFVTRYEAAGRALRELRLPLWNPYEFFGVPLLGSGQGAMLYPPIAVLFALFPPRWALQALYALHLVIYAVATTRYALDHGVSAIAAPLAPILGVAGLFYGIGYNGFDHPSFVCVLAWVPVMLLCLERAIEGPWPRWTGLLALAAAAQWLSGYPEFVLDFAVLLALAALLHPGGRVPRRIAIVALGLALGAALAAPQILAIRDTVAESIRPEHLHNYAATRENVMRVRSLADLERGPLKSAFAAALPLAALAALRLDRARLYWAVALLWCAFPLNPPFALLYELPGFADSRAPAAWGFMGGTFLGLLVAAGVSEALALERRWLRIAASALALGVAAHGLSVVARVPTLLRVRAPDYPALAVRADLVRRAAARFDPEPRIVDAEQTDGGGLLRHELRSPTGYEPALPPRRAVHLLKDIELHESPGWGRWDGIARRPALAALAGIGLVAVRPEGVAALEAAGFRPVDGDARLPGGDVLVHREPLPRARIVHRAVVVGDDLASLRRILSAPGDARDTAVLEAPADVAGLSPPPPGAAERVAIAVDEPERVALDADLASPGLVVLADAFAPGWQAFVDGERVDVMPADHVFRAVRVPPGRHRIDFHYRPGWLVPGFAAFALAGAAVALLVWRGGRRSPPR
ncbi:MAG TPA: YfhO family protein [Candidatus Binatia bacterium]|nr:YfhO family protein [Candidatus Binatia bacterium]